MLTGFERIVYGIIVCINDVHRNVDPFYMRNGLQVIRGVERKNLNIMGHGKILLMVST